MKKTKKKDNVKFLSNKRGSSYWFIYTLIFAFVIVLLYIIFNQTLNVYIYPTTQMLTNGDTSKADDWLSMWDWMPFIILLIIGLFLFFKLTQRDTTTGGE